MRRDGHPWDEISASLGWSAYTLAEHVRARGLWSAHRIDLPVATVVEEYKAGASLLELGRRHGCSQQTIRHRLVAAGVPIRDVIAATALHQGSATAHADLPAGAIVDAYRAGVSAPMLAKQYEVSKATIHRLLAAQGVPLRSRSEAALLRYAAKK